MPKFNFSSRYYAEDKDIYDLLKASGMTVKQLVRIGRKRGLYISEQEMKEEILKSISVLPHSWVQLHEIMAEISTDDREQKVSMVKVSSPESLDKMREAANFVQELRAASKGESYSISETSTGQILVKVKYTDFDPKTTRLMQRREREIKIEIEKVGARFEIRHEHTGRAVEIVDRIVEVMNSGGDTPAPIKETVDLSGVTDPDLRTKFFTNLFSSIDGFRFVDVKDLKVDKHIVPDQASDEDSETEEKPGKEKVRESEEQFKSLVRKMILSGDGILLSPEYRELRKNNFYITKASWIAHETSGGAGRNVLFTAEFSGEEAGRSFVYDVRWMWERDEDGDLREEKSALTSSDRAVFLRKLEASAFNAADSVKVELSKQKTAATPKPVREVVINPVTNAPKS